jgi:hypothetical protein
VPAYPVQVVREGSHALGERYVYEAPRPPAERELIRVRLESAYTTDDTIPVRVTRVYGDLIMARQHAAR